MNNKKKEGSFYASKVRLFLNEYGGINLEDFCKAEQVSYSKMCNCLGRPSYRKSKPQRKVDLSSNSKQSEGILPELELKPLVVDMPQSVFSVESLSNNQSESQPLSLGKVNIRICNRFDVILEKCDILSLVSLMKEMEVRLC